MSAPAAPAPSELLAFFQAIFPEELYAFGAPAPAPVPAPEPAPEPAAAPPEVPRPADAPAEVELVAGPVALSPRPIPQPTPAAPPLAPEPPAARPVAVVVPAAPTVASLVPPVPATPEPVPASPPPAFVPGTTHQQSRGDGSGAIIVQRIPAAEFAKLNQHEFWVNFLKFLGYDWPTVRLVNVLTNEPLPLPELLASVPDAPRLLLFGSGLVTPLPPAAPAYERYALPDDGPELLRAHAAADLTPERKRLLLAAVQGWKS